MTTDDDTNLNPPVLGIQETACLQCLRPPGYDDDRAERATTPVQGTCEWLLHHPKYLRWREDRQSSFLWISGYPGCGKSHLASFVADRLKSESAGAGPGETVCSFFFHQDDEEWNSATSAIRTLVYQLFTARPALLKHALPRYQSKGAKLVDDFSSLWSIFTTSLADPTCGPVICVIDALDECHESNRPLVVNAITGYYSSSALGSLKVLTTSRPYNEMISSLPAPRLELEQEIPAITKDIERVVKVRMQEICARKGISDAMQQALTEWLLANADRTFLWVSLAMQMISESNTTSQSALDELLNTLPRTLNDTYSRMLENTTDPEKAMKMLHIIVAAARPLSLHELNVAFSIRSTHRSVQELERDVDPMIEQTVRDLCGLFVRVIESRVYLVHQTAREFLVNSGSSESEKIKTPWRRCLHLVESNTVLAERCIWYLLLAPFESEPLEYRPVRDQVAHSRDPHRDDHIHQYRNKFDFLSYAASFWAIHFQESDIREHSATMKLSFDLCNTRTKRFQTWFQIYWLLNRERTLCPMYYTDLQVRCHFGHNRAVQQLLDGGADVAERTGDAIISTTALHVASRNGHAPVVSLLLGRGADISSRDGMGATALFAAASCGHDAVVQLLLEAGSDVHARSNAGIPIVINPAFYGYESTLKLLLASGADIHATFNGESALHRVVMNGNEQTLRLLLAEGMDVNIRARDGETPLHRAAQLRNVEMVALLLDHGADVHARDDTGSSALSYAVHNGGAGVEEIVSLLLSRGADISESTRGGTTLLHIAAMTGTAALISLLLQRGAAVNAQDTQNRTPLHYACGGGRGGPPEARIDLLLVAGANLTARTTGGQTPLHHAVIVGSEEKVAQLIRRGASATIQDGNGHSSLHHAALHGHEKIADLLVRSGADITATDVNHETPLHLACLKGHTSVVDVLLKAGADLSAQSIRGSAIHLAVGGGSAELMNLLIARGADIDARGADGVTPLMLAVAIGENSLVQLLVRGGADVNAKSITGGGTALHIAAQQGLEVSTVQLLVEHGADINARGSQPAGETPLHVAAQHGQHAIARFLLASGADVRARYASGETALHRAAVSGQADMVSWLLDNGADINATADNDTALSLAALRGQNPVVEVLVEKGASRGDTSRALIYAAGGGHVAVMETLVRAGAYIDIPGTSPLHMAVERNQVSAVEWLCAAGADVTVRDLNGQTALDVACSLGYSEVAQVLRGTTQSGSRPV